jgi:hypothetical protein
MAATSKCQRCEEALIQAACGCWIDRSWRTRWCHDSKSLHQPPKRVQPERCAGERCGERDALRTVRQHLTPKAAS